MKTNLRVYLLFVAGSLVSMPAHAQTVFRTDSVATVRNAIGTTISSDGAQTSGGISSTSSALATASGTTARGESRANPGALGVRVESTSASGFVADTVSGVFPPVTGPLLTNGAGFQALTTLAFAGPTSLNLNLTGKVLWNNAASAFHEIGVNFFSTRFDPLGAGRLRVSYIQGDASGLGYVYNSVQNASYRVEGSELFSAYNNSLLTPTSAFDFNFLVTTGTFAAPTSFLTFVSLSAGGTTNLAGPSSVVVDTFNTLSFPTTGPVFNVSAGNTVNAPGVNVINNQFVPSVAPEIPTLPLLLLGVLGVGFGAARRTSLKARA